MFWTQPGVRASLRKAPPFFQESGGVAILAVRARLRAVQDGSCVDVGKIDIDQRPQVRHFDYASAAAERAYRDLPMEIQATFGFDLWQVQRGEVPSASKTLEGFGSADVRELIDDDEAGTYRAVCTVRFEDTVYVFHAFQKKSKRGIETDRQTIDLIKQRLTDAEMRHREWRVPQRKEGGL